MSPGRQRKRHFRFRNPQPIKIPRKEKSAMTQQQFENRKERAENEPLVIARTDEGFRVYSPSNRIRSYIVSGSVQAPSCTCPDFQYHDGDASWRCKHILAVLAQYDGQLPKDAYEDEERRAIQEEGRPQGKEEQPATNGTSQMLLKRSVSPDGRIDSLSVEFSCAVDEQSAGEITSRAGKMLALQARIIERFLDGNSAANDERSGAEDSADGSVPAKMLNIGGMDGKWGRRLFINVQANDQTLKLFGNGKQLAEAITAAGFSNLAEKIAEGLQLNLPCRVVTKPSTDGRFLNIERVLPNPQVRGNHDPRPR